MKIDLTKRGRPVTHGTAGAYTHYKCRCDLCRQAYADYRKTWKEKNPEKAIAYSRNYYTKNPERVEEGRKRWKQVNRERHARNQRANGLKRSYRLSLSDYQNLEDMQGGVCGICWHSPDDGQPLHVDHDHDTGKVRGLLCSRCNAALGLFKDSPEILVRAEDYLTGNKKTRQSPIL